ncbi:MAG: hypothetical protein JWN83_2573 [Chitinophagaceae bacterium]|nr:hypothetical protein [Chitinophagaceae bacterium]
MDSKIIFIASHHNITKMNWETFGDNDWVYCGVDKDFEDDKVFKFISDFFTEPEIFVVIDRNNSFETSPELSVDIIKKHLSNSEVILCNKEFTKMVEFNKIGVMKRGVIK